MVLNDSLGRSGYAIISGWLLGLSTSGNYSDEEEVFQNLGVCVCRITQRCNQHGNGRRIRGSSVQSSLKVQNACVVNYKVFGRCFLINYQNRSSSAIQNYATMGGWFEIAV